jgi:hypothetical protein
MTNPEQLSCTGNNGAPTIVMQEYVFEVRLVAVVRVRAENESLAREVVVSALGSPSTEEVRLANEADFLMGKQATILAVDFSVDEGSAKVVEIGGKTVDR